MKKYLSLTLIICAFLVFLTSPISARSERRVRDFDNNQLQVYIKDEGFHEQNIAKRRVRDFDNNQLQVYIKDEGFHEQNIAKPRIYVENVGKRTIHGFDLFYYFTVERGKTPVVDSYYLPNGSVRIVNQGRGDYYLHFHFNGVNIGPGEVFPGRDGFVVGLHYSDWSKMNKNNDYSNPGSSKWQVTYRVDVKTIEAPPRRPAPAPRRGHYKPDFHNRERMRQDSRAVLNRTATVIREAQLAARKNGYAHGLSKAFAHQDYARKLHMRGEYREAIFHSMRARNIAYDIIEKNRFSRRPEHDWDDVDYGYMPYAPKDNELDVKIKSDKSDNDYIYISIKLDLD